MSETPTAENYAGPAQVVPAEENESPALAECGCREWRCGCPVCEAANPYCPACVTSPGSP